MEHNSPLFKITRSVGLLVVRGFGWLVHLAGGRKAFVDPGTFPFTRLMEENWRSIREEALAVMARGEEQNIQEVFREQAAITEGDRWRSYMFMIYGHEFMEHMEKCPVTARSIRAEPRISSAMLSVLAPGAALIPHKGPYKGVLRYHLALVVPGSGAECVLEVDGIRRHWVEGGSLLFDDTYLHSARNGSDGVRIVLFLDVVRELPFPLNWMNKVIFGAVARSGYIQNVLHASKKTEKLNMVRRRVQF